LQAERQAPRLRPPGTGPAGTIEFADHGLRDSGAHQPDTRQAWIVIPAITNPGLTPDRSEDLTTPLTAIQLQAGFRLNRHEELIQNVGTPLPPLKTRSARKAR
jgi:hypothetical protein